MDTRLIRPFLYCALLVLLPLVAFWAGFREGADVGVMMDSAPRGGMSLFYLTKIEQGGPTKNLVTSLEADVDIALLWAYRLEHHPLRSVMEPLSGFPMNQNQKSLERLAAYRRTHPSPLRADALALELMEDTPGNMEMRKEALDGARQNDRIIASMVAKYASQPAAPKQ